MKIRNDAYVKAFGKNLKNILEEKKMKVEDLAAYAEIESKSIYRILNGEVNTTISTIFALSKALEIKPEQFFCFDFEE